MSSNKPAAHSITNSVTEISTQTPECFVIMPISDPDEYPKGHFGRVFDDIFLPACEKAGFEAIHPGRVRQTNLIHLDVLQRLLNAPMALCDLSARNPNVLFELGLRQAFDKPVVLVREVGTQDIFDVAPLRYTEYRKERIYHEVVEDQQKVAEAIKATQEAFQSGEGINSIVKLLSLTKPASLMEYREAEKDPVLQIIRAEMSELRAEFRQALRVESQPPVIESSSKPTKTGRTDLNDISVSFELGRLVHDIRDLKLLVVTARVNIREKEKAKYRLDYVKSILQEIEEKRSSISERVFERLLSVKHDVEILEKQYLELPLRDDEIDS